MPFWRNLVKMSAGSTHLVSGHYPHSGDDIVRNKKNIVAMIENDKNKKNTAVSAVTLDADGYRNCISFSSSPDVINSMDGKLYCSNSKHQVATRHDLKRDKVKNCQNHIIDETTGDEQQPQQQHQQDHSIEMESISDSKVHFRFWTRKKRYLRCHAWTNLEKYLLTVCILLVFACVCFIFIALFTDYRHQKDEVKYCLTKDCINTAAQLMAAMDTKANPCEDFFQYACGQWNKRHVIPEHKPSLNTFEQLHDDLQQILRDLLEEHPNDRDSSSIITAKTLYRSCLDTRAIEQRGDLPFKQVLNDLGGWPVLLSDWNSDDFVLEKVLGKMRGKYNAPILIEVWVGADDRNSSVNIIQIDQPKLGMPSREYYLNEQSLKYKRAYRDFMVKTSIELGADPHRAIKELHDVLVFETRLANLSQPNADRHDAEAMYNKMTLKNLKELIPDFDWHMYLSSFIPVEILAEEEVILFSPIYLKRTIELIKGLDKRITANYVLWRIVMGFIPELTEPYQNLRKAYRKVLQGVTRDKVRWQKCVEYINERMGMAVGALFVRNNFRRESKETVSSKLEALEMIINLKEAFDELLLENEWMDEHTKTVARDKAYAMQKHIGYPDFILEDDKLDKLYNTLQFYEDRYFENILKAEKFDAYKTLRKLREPIKHDQWEQDPAVVNAFYNANANDIVFPAGIMQPPFYSRMYSKSLNYGGIGVVIGHEITHGFDDKGRLYDKYGNLKAWWDNKTVLAFRERAQCMIDQYSSYKLEQIDMHINGKHTQGENIADNGGLKQSFRAYKRYVERHGEELPLPAIGLNHNQLFFLNYAQIWCGTMRDEEALQKIRTSVHSPGPIRVLGPLSNSEEFARTYNCPLGSRMNPKHKCAVW